MLSVEKAEKLLEYTQTLPRVLAAQKEVLDVLLDASRESVPEDLGCLMLTIASRVFDEHSEDLHTLLLRVYTAVYTEEEGDALLAFYQSSIGQKCLQKMEPLEAATQKILAPWTAAVQDSFKQQCLAALEPLATLDS